VPDVTRAASLAVAVVAVVGVVGASGCSRVAPVEAAHRDTTSPVAVSSSTAHPMNEEPGSTKPESVHRATVITDAGRIDAVVVDDELEMDVSTSAGWQSAVERDGARARVVWTSGGRSVVVELHGSSSGISQEVVSSG